MHAYKQSPEGLLSLDHPEAIRLLFMAPYAPDGPAYQLNQYTGRGTYPHYHFGTFKRLQRLGFNVQSTSKPYAIVHAAGAVDYVFSLFNRMPTRNPEVFISSYCEYLNIPYMGSSPNIRALAEDKYFTKLIAQSLGIPVPQGKVYHHGIVPVDSPPFPGPYLIKDRYGAASKGLSTENIQAKWPGTRQIIEAFWQQGTDALVEEFIDGIDITVPVIGGENPRILGVFHPPSDKPGSILTEDLKLTDPFGYEWYEPGVVLPLLQEDMLKLWRALGQMDYLRLDYRVDARTGERRFLEFNICCYIGLQSPFGLAAQKLGYTLDDLLAHIITYSLLRQSVWRRQHPQALNL